MDRERGLAGYDANMRRALETVASGGLTFAAWLLVVPAPALATDADLLSGWTCVPEGRECTFGSDCCSNKCVNDPKLGKICKPTDASWTCVPEGRTCTFGSDCCSKKCVNDPKLGKVCKPQGASWTCVPQGRKCTFGSDCCSNKCVNDPKLGKVCKPGGS